MTALITVSTATTAELVAFFNANTGGNPVKKFADRKTAERRVQALVDEMAAGEPAEYSAADECDESDAEDPHGEAAINHNETWYGHTHCPSCGIDLDNGVTTYTDLCENKNHGMDTKSINNEYICLACHHEFGPAVVRTARKPSMLTGILRPAMAASLKIDRQILCVTSNTIYANACQVWKAGLVSAAQGDRLSATLYGEAKRGNRLASLTIGNNVFTLAVK